jgi:hypothetical protein
MARVLDEDAYPEICKGVENVDLADSIAGDGHKLLNVVSIQTSITDT